MSSHIVWRHFSPETHKNFHSGAASRVNSPWISRHHWWWVSMCAPDKTSQVFWICPRVCSGSSFSVLNRTSSIQRSLHRSYLSDSFPFVILWIQTFVGNVFLESHEKMTPSVSSSLNRWVDCFRSGLTVEWPLTPRSIVIRVSTRIMTGWLINWLTFSTQHIQWKHNTYDRFGSISDLNLNSHLHYPNDIDRSLNETVADKIRKYRSDYKNNSPNTTLFMTVTVSTSGRLHSEFVCFSL